MRIHLLSDLHLDWRPWTAALRDADVVLLAGDIDRGLRGLQWAREQFAGPVLLVMGNHDYWGGHLRYTVDKMRAASDARVRLLERDAVVIGGVRFLGATAWTDYTLDGDSAGARLEAHRWMTDFRKIRAAGYHGQYRRLLPRDLVAVNQATRLWLREQLSAPFDGPTVVVTHHAPVPECLPRVDKARPLSSLASAPPNLDPAYANRWEDLLGPPVAVWAYGHTHWAFDCVIRGTRLVSNPRGYDAECGDFDPWKIIEL